MALLEIHLQVVRSHLMISTQVAVSKLLCLCSRLCCRDVGPKGPNSKHSLEEYLWHVASTTSTMASLKLARPQNKQNHHCTMAGNELGKFSSGHEMSKQQSEKQNFHNTNWIALGKLGDTYNFATSPFFTLHDLYWVSVPKL